MTTPRRSHVWFSLVVAAAMFLACSTSDGTPGSADGGPGGATGEPDASNGTGAEGDASSPNEAGGAADTGADSAADASDSGSDAPTCGMPGKICQHSQECCADYFCLGDDTTSSNLYCCIDSYGVGPCQQDHDCCGSIDGCTGCGPAHTCCINSPVAGHSCPISCRGDSECCSGHCVSNKCL